MFLSKSKNLIFLFLLLSIPTPVQGDTSSPMTEGPHKKSFSVSPELRKGVVAFGLYLSVYYFFPAFVAADPASSALLSVTEYELTSILPSVLPNVLGYVVSITPMSLVQKSFSYMGVQDYIPRSLNPLTETMNLLFASAYENLKAAPELAEMWSKLNTLQHHQKLGSQKDTGKVLEEKEKLSKSTKEQFTGFWKDHAIVEEDQKALSAFQTRLKYLQNQLSESDNVLANLWRKYVKGSKLPPHIRKEIIKKQITALLAEESRRIGLELERKKTTQAHLQHQKLMKKKKH